MVTLRRAWSRRWALPLVAIVAVCVAAVGAVMVYRYTRPPLIPDAIRQQAPFQLYYPANLPDGMTVDPNSFRSPSEGVVIFVVRSGNSKIAVSEQPRPTEAQVNIDTFVKTNVLDPVTYLSPEGQATVGHLADGQRFGTLVADVWIIVTAPADVGLDRVRSVVNTLRPFAP